jgi:stage V sporulation protein B
MKRTFFTNAVVLTLTTQLLRVVGLFFIAFLSGRIGAEGVGLYQLTFSVYFLAATMASSGIGIAVSRLTAESIAISGYRYMYNVVRRSAAFSLFTGLTIGFLLFAFSGFIGKSLLGDSRSVISLKTLSFGLPFMALSSCLRGYFYGVRKIMIPASQMIFEQGAQLAIVLAIIDSFASRGLEYSCLAIAVSSTMTEILSCGYGFVFYMFERARSALAVKREKDINRRILSISVPVAASSYLRAGLRTAENILIPSGLRRNGHSEGEALSRFGLIGMAMPVLLFPSSFLTAVSALLLPEISEAYSLQNAQRIKKMFLKVFQYTVMLSLLFSGIFIAFSRDFGMLIYQNADAALLIMLLAPLVPLIYLDFIVDSMLNGLNQQMKTLKINILDYTLRIGLILILIPKYGFFAYIAIYYLSTMLNAFLSIRHLLFVSEAKLDYLAFVIKPLLAVLASGLAVKALSKLISLAEPSWLYLALKIALMAAIYTIILFIIRCVGREDAAWLISVMRQKPGGRKADGESFQSFYR